MKLRATGVRRIAQLFALSQFAVVAAVLAFVQWQANSVIADNARQGAHDFLQATSEIVARNGHDAAKAEIRAQITARRGRAVIALRHRDGRIAAGNLESWPATLDAQTNWRVMDLYIPGSNQPESIGLASVRLKDGGALLFGEVLTERQAMTRVLESALGLGLLGALIFAVGTAIALSRFLNARIEDFAWAADTVSRGDLTRRINRLETDDAFDHLARAINAMLDHLASLVEELRTVTDMLAHDLRSPLSRLGLKLERAAAKTDDPAILTALEGARDEAELLRRTLETALQISRAEAGIGHQHFTHFGLDELLDDLLDLYEPVFEEEGKTLNRVTAPELRLFGHRDLLVQAMSNLVDNALKYAKAGRFVEVGAARESGAVSLWVRDDGPGIPAERHKDMLKRFSRLSEARTSPGAGLGLSLVDAVARLHGGHVRLETPTMGGLKVVLNLPESEKPL